MVLDILNALPASAAGKMGTVLLLPAVATSLLDASLSLGAATHPMVNTSSALLRGIVMLALVKDVVYGDTGQYCMYVNCKPCLTLSLVV